MSQFALNKVELLKDLSQKELNFLADFFSEKEYNYGNKIFRRGMIRDKVLIITEGSVALKQDPDGEQTIALFKQHDVLSEMALIDKTDVHSYNLDVASKNLKVLELSVYSWHTIVKKNPELANKIYKNIASVLKRRLTHANNKLWALFAAGKIIGTYDDLMSMIEEWIDIILQIIPAEKIAFMSFSHATRKIHVHKNVGFKLSDDTFFDIDEDPLLPQLIDAPNTVILAEGKWPKEYDKLPYKCKTLMITPIKIQKKVIGFIILGNKINKKNFSVNNKVLLEALATQVAPAIQDVMISEMTAAEKEIKQVYIDPFIKS
jgi:CRP-like cAMP-binding protein